MIVAKLVKTDETTLRIAETTTGTVTIIPTTTSTTQFSIHSTSKTESDSTEPEIPQFEVNCTDPHALCRQNAMLEEVPTDVGHQRTAIINMDLTYNVIEILDSKSFTGLTQLKVLVLNHNKISSIEPGTFSGQSSVTHLDLSYNVLQTLNGAMFQGLASLRVLRITGNKITSIDPKTFSNLHQINNIQVDIIQLTVFRQIILNPSNYPATPKVRKVTVEDSHSFPCNSSYCWLKALEEKGYMDHYKYNGRVSRPKCLDRPGVYWDQVELDCSSSSHTSSSSGIQRNL